LRDGFVFARLHVTPRGGDVRPELLGFWGIEPIIWHIAEMTFSPYAPVIHEMAEITDPIELAAANAADGELPLKDRPSIRDMPPCLACAHSSQRHVGHVSH
jgi:hypothetical protein